MAKITTTEALPFPLEKPNPDTFVTQGDKIGWGDKSMTQAIEERNDAKSTTGNANATSIESKINAIIDCLQLFIQGAVFHSGTPFVTPQELSSQLNLLRYTYSGSNTTPAICGQAICGQTICGTV